MTIFRSAAVAASLLAGATLIAAPVAAATRAAPRSLSFSARPIQPLAWNAASETFNDHRWDGYHDHHDGFDGGNLLGLLLIGGGIVAVAAAIDKEKQERNRYRTNGRDYPKPQRPYDYRSNGSRDGERQQDRGYGRDGDAGQADYGETDRAVAACSAEAARSGEVDEIYDVEKVAGEWRIKGDFQNGREFTCSVDGNGKAYVGQGDQAANDARGDDRYATGRSPDFTDTRWH